MENVLVVLVIWLKFVVLLLMSHKSTGCRVEQCGVKLTPEHVTQISMIVKMGITEQQCLNKLREINLSQYSAVYCPEEQLCGLDLHPEKTKALKFLANQTCILFAKEEEGCVHTEKQLFLSG